MGGGKSPEPGNQEASTLETSTFRKVTWRLVPLLFAAYFLAFLDRVNVGVAKLQMASDLRLSDAVFGFGAGIFFLGYFLFEVPSNLILQRVGARLWIARIMITWGLFSAAFAFTGMIPWGPVSGAFGLTDAQFSFYSLRFLLGLAEAGFYPGVVLYLTFWFPDRRRAQIIALFMAAIPLSGAIGSPLSGSILEFVDGAKGWNGWQWLFVIEGTPAALLGLVVLLALPDNPSKARWLDARERDVIERHLHADEIAKQGKGYCDKTLEIFFDIRIWTLAIAEFCCNAGGYAITFWAPTIVQELGVKGGDYLAVGLVLMIPWSVAAIGMVLCARHSDRTGERRWHATIAASVLSAGLLILAFAGSNPALSLIGLAMVAAGNLSWFSVFWSIPTSFLSGAAAAGGIAMINSIGNLGGYFGPDLVGAIRQANGGDATAAFLVLSAAALICAGLTFLISSPRPAVAIRAAT
jgi:MFS transporter, ACS family, tartrate transporter